MKPRPDTKQEELPLSSVAPHRLFPGRTSLYTQEVASALSITTQQVIDLIVCGDLIAINISATRTAGLTSQDMSEADRRRVPRTHWRVPVSAYDAFLATRKSA